MERSNKSHNHGAEKDAEKQSLSLQDSSVPAQHNSNGKGNSKKIMREKETAKRTWVTAERARAEEASRINNARMHWQKEAFMAALNGSQLEESLNIAANIVLEEMKGEARIAFYIADADGSCLHPVWGAGTMPDAYLKVIDGFRIGADSLACWLAVPTGRAILTRDVYEEPLWKPWTFLARDYDYRACWSFPIKTSEQSPVGTFALYFHASREASQRDIIVAEVLTQTAAVLIANYRETQERIRAGKELQDAEKAYRIQLEQEVRERTAQLRQSKNELEHEHHFLEQVTDKAPLLIYVFDLRENLFTFINKQVERLVGRDQEYVYAMGPHLFQAIIHPDDIEKRSRYMSELSIMRDNEVREMEFRIWNGKEFRWFRSRDSIFRQERGRVKQVIGIAEDISYEKKFDERTSPTQSPVGLN